MRRFIIPLLERVNYGGKYRHIHYQKIEILDIMTKPNTFKSVFEQLFYILYIGIYNYIYEKCLQVYGCI